MATFWKRLKNKYKVKTYQDAKNSYDWIMKALRKGGFDCESMSASFLFTVSGILCSCDGIDEFTENAYGYTDYDFNNFRITFWPEKFGQVGIEVNHENRVSISTESKVLLEEIVNLLESTTLDEEKCNPTVVVNMKAQSPTKQFVTGIIQNVASNFVWYLLTLAAGGFLTYLMTK